MVAAPAGPVVDDRAACDRAWTWASAVPWRIIGLSRNPARSRVATPHEIRRNQEVEVGGPSMPEVQRQRGPASEAEGPPYGRARQAFQSALLASREDGCKQGSSSRCRKARQNAMVFRVRIVRPLVRTKARMASSP